MQLDQKRILLFSSLLALCTSLLPYVHREPIAAAQEGIESFATKPQSERSSANAGNFHPSSGVYGRVSSGGGAFPGHSSHAHGKCVEILSATSQHHVTDGQCDENGNFRVALAPGEYIVSTGGRRDRVQVREGVWTRNSFSFHAAGALR